jgi:predicted site-specific integrase-resolvase
MIKDAVFVQLEKIRKENIINKNTQAKVVIKLKDNHNKFTVQQLQKFLNVAQCEIIVDNTVENIQAECSNANLVRCERC